MERAQQRVGEDRLAGRARDHRTAVIGRETAGAFHSRFTGEVREFFTGAGGCGDEIEGDDIHAARLRRADERNVAGR